MSHHHKKNHNEKQDEGKRPSAGEVGMAEGEKQGVSPASPPNGGKIEVSAQDFEDLKKKVEELGL